MKRYSILVLSIFLLLISCSKSDPKPDPVPKPSKKSITSFVFKKSDNPNLAEDVEGVITGTEIRVFLRGIDQSSLKPTITYTAAAISPTSTTAKDFTTPQTYTLTAEDGSTAVYTVKVTSANVYAAGYETNSFGTRLACYWTNGVKTILSDGKTDVELSGIYVSGNDVYVCATDDGTAVYWKNGVKVSLHDGVSLSDAHGIIVNGTDVYVVGSKRIRDQPKIAVYWKNGVAVPLTNGINQGIARSIAVVNNDVYVTGVYYPDIYRQNAVYWKNGTMTTLIETQTNYFSGAISMAVSGADVYIFGIEGKTDEYFYWKNGVKNDFNFGNNYMISMAVEGSNVYFVGARLVIGATKEIIYYKNSTLNSFTTGMKDDLAPSCVTVLNDNLIIGGTHYNLDQYPAPLAAYWVNGKAYILSDVRSKVSAITVK